jgi:DNA repair exonuclease SbcCD ATPase subunit
MRNITALRALHAINFCRHKELNIAFGEKLTVIMGPNATGKTSLHYAILFAIGGSTLVPGGRERLVRHGQKDCLVSLTFDCEDKHQYTVQRSLRDAQLHKHLENDEKELIASGHTAVNAWIENSLGQKISDWVIQSWSRQTHTAALMTLGTTKLNQMIEQMAEADFVERVAERAKNHEKTANDKLQALPPPIDLEPLRASMRSEEILILDIKDAQEALEMTRSAASIRRTELGAQINQAREHNKTISETEHTRDVQLSKIDDLEREHEELTAKFNKLQENNEAIAGIDKLKELRDDLRNKAAKGAEGNQQIELLKNSIKAKEDWLTGIGLNTLNAYKENAAILDSLNIEIAAALEKKTTAAAEKRIAESEHDAAKDAHGRSACPTCKRPYDAAAAEHAQQLVAERHKRMEDAKRIFTDAFDVHRALQVRHGELLAKTPADAILTIFPLRETELKDAKEKLATLTPVSADDLRAFTTDAARATERVAELAQIKWQIEALTEKLDGVKSTLARAREKVQECQDKLQGLTAIDVAPMEEERTQMYTKEMTADKEIADNRVKLGMHETNVKNIKQKIESEDALSAQRAILSAQAAGMGGLKKYLRENKTVYMADMWDRLMALTAEFTSSVMDRVEMIGRSEDGEFWIEEEGHRLPMVAASGGQAAIAGVGLRLSLPSVVASGSRIILLDEPSSELRDDVAAALAGALKAQDRQIILITHRQGEEFISDATIELDY